MAKRKDPSNSENPVSEFFEVARRAFAEFLLVPTFVIAGFLLLALGSYALDRSQLADPGPVRLFLKSHIFANADATSSLLGAVAAGVITMTSISISLLLIAVQQSASSMTGQVYDQFLRRKTNQIYFGYFIGLALFSMITLATVNEPFNPVFGATIAFFATAVSLYLLILLLYTTINQMRPIEIIEAIHAHILAARGRQLDFVRHTRRVPHHSAKFAIPVRAEKYGFITRIDLDMLSRAADGNGQLVLLVSIGSFVAFDDVIAEARAETHETAERISEAASASVRIERQRDIALDPSYGIEQIEMIGWTSISTSKSNPAPGLFAIQCLRDVMSRWSEEEKEETATTTAPVVYRDDVFTRLFNTLETFAVVSSESMQHQIYIEVVRTLTSMYGRLSAERRDRADDMIMRILSVLGDHVLTAPLDEALKDLADTLESYERPETAEAVRRARAKLADSIGKLGSRATRAG